MNTLPHEMHMEIAKYLDWKSYFNLCSAYRMFMVFEPTKVQQIEMVMAKPESIRFITNPCKEAQIMAVKGAPWVIIYIENPCLSAQIVYSHSYADKSINRLHESVKLALIAKYSSTKIKNPSIEASMMMAVSDSNFLVLERNHPLELIHAHLSIFPENIIYFDNPSDWMIDLVLSKNGSLIKHFDDCSVAKQLLAVNQNGNAIRYIQNPTYEVMRMAIMSKPDSIRFIDKPDKSLRTLAYRGIKRKRK